VCYGLGLIRYVSNGYWKGLNYSLGNEHIKQVIVRLIKRSISLIDW
jgi:hypothetical protein